MEHLALTETLFLSKHIDQSKKLVGSQSKWSVVAFSGNQERRRNFHVVGATPSDSSNEYFQQLEYSGFPEEITTPKAIWTMEPYPWLSKLSSANLIQLYSPKKHLFDSFNDKFGFFSELLRGSTDNLQYFLRKQFSDFEFKYHWSPGSTINDDIFSTSHGAGGSGLSVGSFDGSSGVIRSSRICYYEIGGILQSIVFGDGVVHGPIGRTWSGQLNNNFRNSCIFYQHDLDKIVDCQRIYDLQTDIGNYMRLRGFRGAFSTDWLISENRKDIFLLEVNPRFSSDLCLFDCAWEGPNSSRFPLGVLHLYATANTEIPDHHSVPKTFWEFGGGTNRAYFPPDGQNDPTNHSLTMASRPNDSFMDTHTNFRLLEAVRSAPLS